MQRPADRPAALATSTSHIGLVGCRSIMSEEVSSSLAAVCVSTVSMLREECFKRKNRFFPPQEADNGDSNFREHQFMLVAVQFIRTFMSINPSCCLEIVSFLCNSVQQKKSMLRHHKHLTFITQLTSSLHFWNRSKGPK